MPLKTLAKRLFRGIGRYDDPVRNLNCKFLEVDLWTLSEFIVDKLVPITGVHPFPLNEQLLMSASVVRFRPTHLYEWGTNIGKSARIFHEVATTFNIDTEIHTIDLPDDVTHAEHPGAGEWETDPTLLQCDSAPWRWAHNFVGAMD